MRFIARGDSFAAHERGAHTRAHSHSSGECLTAYRSQQIHRTPLSLATVTADIKMDNKTCNPNKRKQNFYYRCPIKMLPIKINMYIWIAHINNKNEIERNDEGRAAAERRGNGRRIELMSIAKVQSEREGNERLRKRSGPR